MLKKLLTFYFGAKRRRHLIPFVDGLFNLGRPSSVFFPPELIEQGLGLLLSGLNNTLAVQSNLDWLWSQWIEKQQNPAGVEFIPTGVNLVTANLSQRNWTSIGVKDSVNEAMVDPVGMLTLFPFGWSVIPFVKTDTHNFFPQKIPVKQSLSEGFLPSVVTQYDSLPGLEWKSVSEAIEVDGEELVFFRNSLTNSHSEKLQIIFGVSIRPYNSLTIGHINKIKLKNNLWRVNKRPGVLLLSPAHRCRISDRRMGDPLLSSQPGMNIFSLRSLSGICSGVSEWDVVLEPGETRHFDIAGMIAKKSSRPNSKFAGISNKSIEAARIGFREKWLNTSRAGTGYAIPDPQLKLAFYGVKCRMHVFDDLHYFTPGTFFYHDFWVRDGAFISMAFENLGFVRETEKKIPHLMGLQDKEGFFKSQSGEWDSTGQALYTIIQHCRKWGKRELLLKHYSKLLKGVKWIQEKRKVVSKSKTPHDGLLPAGFSAEHFGPNDHYFWDNFWGLAGIQEVAWVANYLGNKEDAINLGEIIEDYYTCLSLAIREAHMRLGTELLPCSTYRTMDSAAIGSLVAVSPLDLYSQNASWVKPTVNYLWEHNIRNGLFFQKIIHTGLNPYLSIQLARVLLTMGDNRWEQILDALLTFSSPTFTWPEAIHPVTHGGCMGDGDHGWVAAEFINFIREMMIRETQNELILALGVRKKWLNQDCKIGIENAATIHGMVSWEISIQDGKCEFSWEISRNEMQAVVPVFLCVPEGFTCRSGGQSVNEWDRGIVLSESSGSIILTTELVEAG